MPYLMSANFVLAFAERSALPSSAALFGNCVIFVFVNVGRRSCIIELIQ